MTESVNLSVNELMNDKCVCRAGPWLCPGLIKKREWVIILNSIFPKVWKNILFSLTNHGTFHFSRDPVLQHAIIHKKVCSSLMQFMISLTFGMFDKRKKKN